MNNLYALLAVVVVWLLLVRFILPRCGIRG